MATYPQELAKAQKAASAGGAAPTATTPADTTSSRAAPAGADQAAQPEGEPWKVVVHTSDVSGGAFDGEVYVQLYTPSGSSTSEVLLPSNEYRWAKEEVACLRLQKSLRLRSDAFMYT